MGSSHPCSVISLLGLQAFFITVPHIFHPCFYRNSLHSTGCCQQEYLDYTLPFSSSAALLTYDRWIIHLSEKDMDLRLLWNYLSPYMTRISAAPFLLLSYMADQMLGVCLSVQTGIKRHFKKIQNLKKKYLIRQKQIYVASLWLCRWVLCYLENLVLRLQAVMETVQSHPWKNPKAKKTHIFY